MAKAFDVDTAGTLETSLVSWWNMEASSIDEFSNNDGTDTNISYVAGKIQNAADFGGTSKIVTPNDFTWTKVSISYWVKFDTLDANDRFLFGKTNTTIGAASDFEFTLGVDASGSRFGLGVNNSDLVFYSLASAGITTGVWYHILGTIDEDNDTAELFINGTSVAAGTGKTQTHNNLTNGVNFGRRRDDFAPLDGQMDLLGLWTKKLSAQEISDLYNGGTGNAYRTQAGGGVVLPYPTLLTLGVG